MKRIFYLSVSTALLMILSVTDISAQRQNRQNSPEGHELVFNVKDAQDSMVYLAIHFRDKLLLKDSTKAAAPGRYIFKGDERYDDGLYMLVSQTRIPYLNFILDRNQHFQYNLDTTGNVHHFSAVNSPENSEMLSFQKKTTEAQQLAQTYNAKRREFESKGQKDSVQYYVAKMRSLNEEMNLFINALIERNPDYLFSKMQKAYQPVHVPDPPVLANGSIDSNFQAAYYFTHYWDHVDLNDNRFLYLPVFESMFNDYFKKNMFYQETDTIIKYVDLFLSKVEHDSLMYRYCLERVTYEFESSKMLGHDAVFVHIAKNNQLNNKATWLDESIIRKYRKRVDNLEPLLIGKPAVELIIADTTGNVWHSSHQLPSKYVVLWFYDPECQTCKRESAKLKVMYDSLTRTGSRNFEIYGIGNDTDTERWIRYVRNNKFPWINVGGNVANVDYLTAYNIHETGNPSMFILDEKRNIILNRRIDVNKIPEFLQQHEKIQELKKKREKARP